MKRHISLVTYASSDDESAADIPGRTTEPSPTPPTRKRKLPKLSLDVIDNGPVQNPALHQGRMRTTPHVDGQFAAYVYVPIPVDHKSRFARLLRDVVGHARKSVPMLHSDWMEGGAEQVERGSDGLPPHTRELHISLSRPIYLRHHQREDLKRAVKRAAQTQHPFAASFATFATFENDERTRAFIGVEVGAGHAELKSLSDALTPTLHLLHQQPFYPDPRFHASFAWALLDKRRLPQTDALSEFPAIPVLPSSLLPHLSSEYGSRLASKLGVFEVSEVRVKIGKDVFAWHLTG